MDLNQHVRIKAIIEIIGKPKEHVEKTLKEYLDNIREDENLIIVTEEISPAKEQENMFGTFAEIEVVVKGISNLVGFCIDYMPSSVEILKPEEFNFPERTFTEFINDLIAKLHNVDMIAKKLGTENRVLKENMAKLINNHLLVLMKFGVTSITKLTQTSGLAKEEVTRYLDALIKEGRVIKEGDVYSLK